MKKDVLGVKVDDVNMDQALETVHKWLKGKKKRCIVTPNPEIIMAAQKDSRYRKLLNDADLSIPDGIGLKLSGKVKNHVAGVDFMEELVKQSIDWGVAVGFLGGRGRVAERTADCLRNKYPKLKVSFVSEEPGEIPATDILFVAFGAPKQEQWIADNLDKIPVKVAMSVGGSFDYISGAVPRAPFWIRKAGFEWLFRLIVQPWRMKRQLALIKYVLLLIYDSH